MICEMSLLKCNQRLIASLRHMVGLTATSRFLGNDSRCQFNKRRQISPLIQLKTLESTIQFRREYVEDSKKSVCWNCKKSTTRKNNMLCAECGLLQDTHTDINYFTLLNCPQSFDIEPQTLTHHFRQLQTIVHPDKYSNKSEREQSNSADWSSLINKAYKTLATPMERGQYLLKLKGVSFPEDNSALNKEFLMEMMERNEEVEDADTEKELRQLDERIVHELRAQVKELIVQFNRNELEMATMKLVQMKYLLSLQQSIKTKLQSLPN